MGHLSIAVVIGCLLLVGVSSIHLAAQQGEDSRVKVNLYFQTICHHSRLFLIGPLKQAINTPDFWKICDFNLYPWGNANRRRRGDHWEIICQHGLKECEGNIIETCALHLYEKYSQAIPFIICLEEGNVEWVKNGKVCAEKIGMDWGKIHECSLSEAGYKYELEMADATESLHPPRKSVPWFTVNGEHTEEINQKVLQDLVGYVCSVYKGPVQIEACK